MIACGGADGDEVLRGRGLALPERELVMVQVDHHVRGREEGQAEDGHVILVGAHIAVDEDFAVAAVVDVLLARGVDPVIWDDELVVRDCDVEAGVDGDGEVAIVAVYD